MPHALLINLFNIAAQAEEHATEAAAQPDAYVLNVVWLLPALPLLAFLINGLFGRRLKKVAGPIATILVGLSFVMTLAILAEFIFVRTAGQPFEYDLYTWIPSGDFTVNIAFLIDPLTVIMLLVVTSVSTLVHVYSIGYMSDDPDVA